LRDQDLLDQVQRRVLAFGFAGVVEAGGAQQAGDRLGAVVVPADCAVWVRGLSRRLQQVISPRGHREVQMSEARPPLPPFTEETAVRKIRAAEDAWNTRDPDDSGGPTATRTGSSTSTA
jgi:Protein of unknown function (DUF1348)